MSELVASGENHFIQLMRVYLEVGIRWDQFAPSAQRITNTLSTHSPLDLTLLRNSAVTKTLKLSHSGLKAPRKPKNILWIIKHRP